MDPPAAPADPWRTIGARLAYQLVAADTRPGDVVVDLTADHTMTAVCAAGFAPAATTSGLSA
ncbi:hypothetical protein ACSNOB_03090 [Micromonospora sp. URMC 106]|uniref:hypothetical protein n=1 Tax=Micromonospora sp. URMC 106 TaxID=3423408 RepID=UPI003F1C80D2